MRFPFANSLILSSIFAVFTICTPKSLHADSIGEHANPPPKKEPTPWLTGPLLTPSGHCIPNGHYNIEPYEFITANYGVYDQNWHTHNSPNNLYNVNTQIPVQIGMPANLDFFFNPAWSWNHIQGASHWVLNDMGWGFDYQILNDKPGTWWSAIKLQLRANFPIGKYQKLNPHSKGTDIGGTGSWLPGFGIVMSHLYWWGGNIFFAPRFNVEYTIPNAVHVKNFNAYGGGHHTHGTVYPGQQLLFLFGFELAVSRRWALAGDIQYLHVSKTRFKGHKGKTDGVPNVIGSPSSEQWSIAPAIEYNWNAYYGIIAGAWFSVAGRNQLEFASGVIALNIYK